MSLRLRIPAELACGLFGVAGLAAPLLVLAFGALGLVRPFHGALAGTALVSLPAAIVGLYLAVRSMRRAGWRPRDLPRRKWVLVGTLASAASVLLCVLAVPASLHT